MTTWEMREIELNNRYFTNKYHEMARANRDTFETRKQQCLDEIELLNKRMTTVKQEIKEHKQDPDKYFYVWHSSDWDDSAIRFEVEEKPKTYRIIRGNYCDGDLVVRKADFENDEVYSRRAREIFHRGASGLALLNREHDSILGQLSDQWERLENCDDGLDPDAASRSGLSVVFRDWADLVKPERVDAKWQEVGF